jgi:hypothetical protein
MTPGETDSQRLRALVLARAADPAIGELAQAVARDTSPAFDALDPEESRRHVQGVIAVVANAFASERALSASELKTIASLGADRAHLRIPLAAVIAGFQTARNELVRVMVASARAAGIASGALVDGLIELDSLLIDVEHHLINAQLSTEAELKRTSHDFEASVVRELLLGSAATPDHLSRAGILPSERYHCIVTSADDPTGIEAANNYLAAAPEVHAAVLDGYLVALALGLPPTPPRTPLLVVASPASQIVQLPALYRLALRARESAQRRGLDGLYPLERLALDIAATSLSDLGAHLAEALERQLGPFRPYHRELVGTALAHVELGSIGSTAAKLYLHPNTVKHRLRRLAELTAGSPPAAWSSGSLADQFSWWLTLNAWLERHPGAS